MTTSPECSDTPGAGVDISKLIRWNKYEKYLPFANQLAFLRLNVMEALYGGGTRGGKVQPYSSTVMTPFGERLMGELQVGELVCTPHGSSSSILQIHEQGIIDVYKVHFSDGRIAEVGLDHLWLIKKTKRNSRKGNKDGEGGWFVADTKWMIEWVNKNKESENNLAVPLCEPTIFTKTYKYDMRPIHPYVLGVLIGDGSFTRNYASLTSADEEIASNLEKQDYMSFRIDERYNEKTEVVTRQYIYKGKIVEDLKKIGLHGKKSHNKFIPEHYKYATVEDRIALIQGLMDTDGYIDDRGHLNYTTVSEQLAKDVQWIIRSLGGRASITTKIPTYTYEEMKKAGQMAYNVWIQIKDKSRLVSLKRKKERCENCDYIDGSQDPSLSIVKIEYDRKEQGRCITIMHRDGLYLTNDFTVTHNSIALLMAAAQYVDVPTYNAIIFRKSYQELSKGDGLIPVSMEWFKKWEDEGAHWDDKLKQWEFPSGAILGFGHLESENDKYNYIGQSYQFIGFDELTQQPEDTYSFLFSRLVRNKEQERLGIPLRMRATTNPNGEHVEWVYNRFVNKRTRPAIRQDIIEKAQLVGIPKETITEEYIRYRMPMFVPSLARDNPFLDGVSYKDSLNKLDPVTRAQLAEGNWEIRAMGNMFSRAWFEKIPYAKVPVPDLKKVRYWDMAATLDGDATAGCHLGYDKITGLFYILDMKIMHKSPRELEREIYNCAFDDGSDTMIFMEREPGSAGIHNIDHYKRKVIPPGWRFYEDRISGNKETRARPVSAAAEKELIKIAWTRRTDDWYSMAMDQLETFPEADHDDAVDALAGAFNVLAQRLNHTARYIGKVDFLMPTDAEMDAQTEFGPRGTGGLEDFVRVSTKNSKRF